MSTPSQKTVGRERQLWTNLQMAETLLFHAAAVTHPRAMQSLFDGFEAQGPARDLLIRAGSGFPAECLRPEDYLARYPFSSIAAIREVLDELVELGSATLRADAYDWSDRGIGAVRVWMERVAAMMSDLDLGDVSPSDVEALIRFDVRVVEALVKSDRPHGDPILRCRLQGIRPAPDAEPALWHHWQRVWTILAASEDEEEHVRRGRGTDPMVWFIRRQLWFIHRRPWRARARTLEGLTARATGYAPVEDAEETCKAALARLVDRGEVEESADGLRLSARGLSICDEDELEVDTNLLARWPTWDEPEIERLQQLVERLTRRLLKLIQAEQGGTSE